jgi:3-oxoacyl-(acyl-carrier-protein) synthase
MGKSIRMGIGAGFPLLQSEKNIDGIILGSSEGGLEDCFKFLNQIVQYEEGTLTPTNFAQSTPNALAGALALMSQNSCYNITHVHKGHAFENSLIDTMLLFNEGKANTILVGNVEEISEYNFNIETLGGQFKAEETTSENLLISDTPGTVCGEGSCMFIVQAKAAEYLARILDIEQISYPTEEDIQNLIMDVLERNHLTCNDIDALILGYNGDNRTDCWYTNATKSFFPQQTIYSYKNLVGEYPTSVAFAVYMATHILSDKSFSLKPLKDSNKPIERILIYNHYKGIQHGLILMSR